MPIIEINKHPSQRELKWFGALFAFFFAIIGALVYWRTDSPAAAFAIWGAATRGRRNLLRRAASAAAGLLGLALRGPAHRLDRVARGAGPHILQCPDTDRRYHAAAWSGPDVTWFRILGRDILDRARSWGGPERVTCASSERGNIPMTRNTDESTDESRRR